MYDTYEHDIAEYEREKSTLSHMQYEEEKNELDPGKEGITKNEDNNTKTPGKRKGAYGGREHKKFILTNRQNASPRNTQRRSGIWGA